MTKHTKIIGGKRYILHSISAYKHKKDAIDFVKKMRLWEGDYYWKYIKTPRGNYIYKRRR